jgi:hypothetical protein
MQESLRDESVLADTFRQTVFNPPQTSRNSSTTIKKIDLSSEEQMKKEKAGISQLLQLMKSDDCSLKTFDSR